MKLHSSAKIVPFLVIGVIIGLIIPQTFNKSSKSLSNPQTQINQNPQGCQSRSNIGDINNDQADEYVLFCGDKIMLGLGKSDYPLGDLLIEDKNSFYDLFHFQAGTDKKDYEDFWILDEALPFPKQNHRFFALVGTYNSGGTYKQAVGVYQFKNNKIDRVFKRGFDDISGRWSGAILSESIPEIQLKGDLGMIGCGGCRMNWFDYYLWNPQTNSFELNNAPHTLEYQTLLKEYEDTDMKGCRSSVGTRNDEHANKSFTQLLQEYPNINMYCDDSLGIKKETLITFFKIKSSIEKITQGENITYESNQKLSEGETCTSSSQCESNKCLATGIAPTKGVCKHYEPTVGCYSKIENGRAISTVCI